MKKYIIVLVLSITAFNSFAQSFKLATYNLRYDNPKDTGNLWVDRREIMTDLITKYGFDIFCSQEAKANQIKDLINRMPQYKWAGIDKQGDGTDEFCAIFYKKERFELVDRGHFWLSETPETSSKGWDAKYKRVCSWVLIKELKTQHKLYVFNTHFDHKGILAQHNSAKLLLQKIGEMAKKHPAILSGDFNFDRNHNNYRLLAESEILKDTFKMAKKVHSSGGSSNGFNINSRPESPIDHIFVSGSIGVMQYSIITDSYNSKLPSDHYPVLAEMFFNADTTHKSKK